MKLFYDIRDHWARRTKRRYMETFSEAVVNDDIETVERVLAAPRYMETHPTTVMAKYGLERAMGRSDQNMLIVLAQHMDNNDLQWIVRHLASKGSHETLATLLPLAGPFISQHKCPLQEAAQNGHIDCVKLLLTTCNPKNNGSKALLLSCQYQHKEVFELLYPMSNPKAVMKSLEIVREQGYNLDPENFMEEYVNMEEAKKVNRLIKKAVRHKTIEAAPPVPAKRRM